MNTKDWVSIIAQFGIDFAIELATLLENNAEPTAEDFRQLKVKYGSKSAAQYLAEAKAQIQPNP